MKEIHEIEQISLQELETISMDKKVEVPERLQEQVETVIAAQALRDQMQQSRKRNSLRPLVIACATVAACLIAVFTLPKQQAVLQDTFTDPLMAYAELERVFKSMSDTMDKGLTMAVENTNSVSNRIDKTYKHR